MDNRQLKKNRLDLEYHGEAQKSNAFLILLTTGILSFLGTFVWVKENKLFYIGIIITVAVSIAGYLLYNRSSERMSEILYEIENIR